MNSFKFPGGELHTEVDDVPYEPQTLDNVTVVNRGGDDWYVTARLRCSDDIMRMLLVCSSLKKVKVLRIPYIPYGRQDRLTRKGEPLSIRVMADLINSVGAETVITLDPHSDVTRALIKNLRVVEHLPFDNHQLTAYDYIVCPDSGARKRTDKFCVTHGIPYSKIIYCDKRRDPITGKLSGFEVHGNPQLGDASCLILDDLTDGGFTHIKIAELLRSKGSIIVDLAVSHAIFSKGVEVFYPAIDCIFTSDSWCTLQSTDKLRIFECESFMETW